MRRGLRKRGAGRRRRGPEGGAGPGVAPRAAAPVARVHGLRRHGHRGRPHAHGGGEPGARARRNRPAEPRHAPLHRGASGTSSGNVGKELTATNFSFSLIPRLNASGRMGDAQVAVDLLMTDDFERGHASGPAAGVHQRRRVAPLSPSSLNWPSEQAGAGLPRPASAYRGGGGLARGREGHRGQPPGERLRRAGPAVHHRRRRGPRAPAAAWGRSTCSSAVESVLAPAHALRRPSRRPWASPCPQGESAGVRAAACASIWTQLPEQAFHPLVSVDACVSLPELTLDSGGPGWTRLAPFGQEIPGAGVFLAQQRHADELPGRGRREEPLLAARSPTGAPRCRASCSTARTSRRSCARTAVVNAAFEVQVDEWRGRRSGEGHAAVHRPGAPLRGAERRV